jgi:hypothetical protein
LTRIEGTPIIGKERGLMGIEGLHGFFVSMVCEDTNHGNTTVIARTALVVVITNKS